jgi:hypothetical protein
MQHQRDGNGNRGGQKQKVDEVLAFVSQRALRQNLLQLARRHQASRDGQPAEDHLDREHRHHEARNVRRPQVKLRRADQGDAKRAKSMAERGSLRDGRHGNTPSGTPMIAPSTSAMAIIR